MKEIHLVYSEGDDYHGGLQIIEAHTNYDAAQYQAREYDADQKPCPDCGDKFKYGVITTELKGEDK